MNNNDLKNRDNYYDLGNCIPIRGFGSDSKENKYMVKGTVINHPDVFSSIYCITLEGYVYSFMSGDYLLWEVCDGYPAVKLLTKSEDYSRKPFLIKDLMAYSYIANARDYLERGYEVYNIDGNRFNCLYSNIIFLDPKGDFTKN